MSNEPEDELTPPDVLTVKRRLMTLWANNARASIEETLASDPAMGQAKSEPLTNYLLNTLAPEPTKGELERHQLPFGRWTSQMILRDSWDGQAAHVLEWALGLTSGLPSWDLGTAWTDDVAEFRTFPDPTSWRPELKLAAYEDMDGFGAVMETCYWRIRITHLLPEKSRTYTLKLLSRAHQLGGIDLAQDGDLLLSDGRSLNQADDDEASIVRSVLVEKLHALNWLCGHAEGWDEVTRDTLVPWLWDENWKENEQVK